MFYYLVILLVSYALEQRCWKCSFYNYTLQTD